MLEYYISKERYINYLTNFVYKHEENIHSLDASFFNFTIYVKSKDIQKKISLDSIKVYPSLSLNKRNDRINSGILILETEAEKQEINEMWIYKLDAKKYKEIPHSFYNYLQIDSTEIKSFQNILSKLHWSIIFTDVIKLEILDTDFGYYEYVLTINPEHAPKDSLKVSDEKYQYYKTGKLQEGVYWQRKIDKNQRD